MPSYVNPRAFFVMQVYPGLNASILEALRRKVANWPGSSKVVVLSIDEMSIKEGLSYDKGRDLIEGLLQPPKNYPTMPWW